jgi:aspartate 1-decarboxylase
MMLTLLKSKIHRIKVAENNADYVGSIFIDEKILQKAKILNNEQVHVYNITNGNRFVTYAVPVREDGYCCVNGAAARLVYKNDLLIVASYAMMSEQEAAIYVPTVVLMDDGGSIK